MAIYEAQCSAVGGFGYAQYFKLYVELTEVDVGIENNTSKIKYNVYCKSSGSGSISANHLKYFNLNGQNIINATEKVNVTGPNANILIASGTTGAIAHSADGSKSVSFSAQIKASSYGVTASLSNTFTLATIPRASTLSISGNTIGSNATISISRASTSFTHNLYYSWGTISNELIASGVGTSTTWTIPKKLANYISNATSGIGHITCQTYSGSTLIGNTVISFVGNIPDTSEFRPNISKVTLEEAMGGLASQFGCFVHNKSRIHVEVTASGAYSSTIKSYKTVINGATYVDAAFVTETLIKSGSNSYTVTVTDSRNRITTYSGTFEVASYSTPQITKFTAVRCNSDGTENEEGGYAKIVLAGNITSVNSKNTYFYRLQYKKSGASSYTDYAISNDAYSISKTITGIAADVDSSYVFMLTIEDYFTSVSKEITLETAFTLLNWNKSGKGFAVGKVSEKDAFEVGMDAEMTGNLVVAGSITAGSIANVLQRVCSKGASGGTTIDTGLTVNGGYGGNAYLVVNTWHTSTGANTGTTIDIISLNYDGGNFATYQVCKINNGSAGKAFSYGVSSNQTLTVYGASPGAFRTNVYKL